MTKQNVELAELLKSRVQSARLPLNLQLFAEEEKKDDFNPQENNEKENSEDNKLPSFEELLKNKKFQSEFDRRITQALNTAKKNWEKSAKEEADESKKLEKMNESQRERYEFNKEKEKFAKDKADFEKEKLKTAVAEELHKRGFSSEFAEFLIGEDAESSTANINAFETAFKKAVESGITDKLRGDQTPPAERQHIEKNVPPEDFHDYERWRKQNA